MKAPLLAISSLFALLFVGAGCGGTVLTGGGDDGGSPSSEAGGDDGGEICSPLPGCSSETECPAGDGCNTCTCSGGGWSCTLIACAPACPSAYPESGECSVEGQFCPYSLNPSCEGNCNCSSGAWSCTESGSDCSTPECPAGPPNGGDSCSLDGQTCNWSSEDSCEDEQCLCELGAWKCESMTCPAPPCPETAPQSNTECTSVGQLCAYPVPNTPCGEVECSCYPAGIWGCGSSCADAGAAPDGI